MRALFVDTGGWMAMADAADPRHEMCRVARDEWLRRGGILLSTDYVLDETLTLIRLRLGLRTASQWSDQIEGSRRVLWEWINPTRAEKARSWFFRWKDKDFSFTDCTSFVVMRELGQRRALTTDHHFAQAGFEMVP
ncbi:MAG: hypothetical protein DMG09_25310 [Acidobacteria bacterium]|nr:MAG: hypothetical protein DMG09_25310 [Acidobacteriota bacterium]